MTLAIGFGADVAAAARARPRARSRAGSPRPRPSYNAGWAAYRGTLDDGARRACSSSAQLRRIYEQSLLVLAASEDKTLPRRLDRRAEHGVDLGHAHARARPPLLRPVPPGLAARPLPRGDRAEGGGRRRGGRAGCSTTSGRCRRPTAPGGRTRASTATEKWTTEQMDQVSLPIVLAWWLGRTSATDWAHVERAADYVVANGPSSDNERWENQGGWSPNTIATEIAGLICAADIARAERRAGQGGTLRGVGRLLAARTSSAGPRPTTARTRPSRTTCASPRTRQPNNGHAIRAG